MGPILGGSKLMQIYYLILRDFLSMVLCLVLMLMFQVSNFFQLLDVQNKLHVKNPLDKVPISTGFVDCRISAVTYRISTEFWLFFFL